MEEVVENDVLVKADADVFGEEEILPDVEDDEDEGGNHHVEYHNPLGDDQNEDNEMNIKYSVNESDQMLCPPVIMPMPVAKRMSLSLQEKLQIINDLQGGEKQAWICKKRRIPKSTIQSIWKNRNKILDASVTVGMDRKRCRRALHENVEAKLVEWVDTLKTQNVPVNGPQLRAKAQVYAKQLGISDFRSSTGWLDKFKTRHNIVFKKSTNVSGNNDSHPVSPVRNDKKAALEWITKVWPNLCEGYSPENIFNADEFSLFFNALPDQVSKLMNETCQNGKLNADRVTVMVCVNSDGSEKRPLLVAGSYNLSGNFHPSALPVHYITDAKSWISRYIFEEELRRWNQELQEEGRNVLIVVDCSPAHEMTELFSHIKIVTLPLSVTSILQPLERGIVQQIKRQYRRLMLDKIIRKTGTLSQQRLGSIGNKGIMLSKLSPTDTNTTIIDALFMLDCAWTDVTSEDIVEGFKSSNLQSINVSSQNFVRSSKGGSKASNINRQKELDASLLLRASKVVHIPPAFTLDDYVLIDSKAHTTDYINDDYQNQPPQISQCNFTLPNLCPNPTRYQIQDNLEMLRRWVLPLVSETESRSIHESLSILENFAIKQSHECGEIILPRPPPQMTNTAQSGPSVTMVSTIQSPESHHSPDAIQGSPGLRQMTFNRMISQGNSMIIETSPTVHGGHCSVSSLGNHGQPTYVSFAINDSVQNQGMPHNILDSQPQFLAYLT